MRLHTSNFEGLRHVQQEEVVAMELFYTAPENSYDRVVYEPTSNHIPPELPNTCAK